MNNIIKKLQTELNPDYKLFVACFENSYTLSIYPTKNKEPYNEVVWYGGVLNTSKEPTYEELLKLIPEKYKSSVWLVSVNKGHAFLYECKIINETPDDYITSTSLAYSKKSWKKFTSKDAVIAHIEDNI